MRVRRWDDAAKVAGAATPPIAHYLRDRRPLYPASTQVSGSVKTASERAVTSVPPIVEILRKSTIGKVKVAVSDIDGILRGKYIHKRQVPLRRRRRLRLLRRGVRLGLARPVLRQHEAAPAGTTASRTRSRALDLAHLPQRAVGRRRAVLPRRFRRRADGKPAPVCPRQVLKRVLEARREDGLQRDGRRRVRVLQLRRDAAVAGPTRRASRRRRSRPGCSATRCCARTMNREYFNALMDELARVRRPDRRPAHRDRPRRVRGGDPRSPRRSRRPTARSCSRPPPRRSASASASCRASWRSGARSTRAARGHLHQSLVRRQEEPLPRPEGPRTAACRSSSRATSPGQLEHLLGMAPMFWPTVELVQAARSTASGRR